MSQYTPLSRTLRSLATSSAPDAESGALGFFSHLREESGELIEERYTPTNDRQEYTVAQDVKEGTPAAYFVNEQNERFAFCLGPDDDLRYYKFDSDSDEWLCDEPQEIPSSITKTIHPETKLTAGALNGNRICVFYQDEEGLITYISGENLQEWEFRGTLTKEECKPVIGTSLQALNVDADGIETLRVYYVGVDGYVHFVELEGDGKKQSAHKVPYAPLTNPKTIKNLAVYRADSPSNPGIFTLDASNSVHQYLSTSVGKTKFGTLNQVGDLVLANKDEFFLLARTGHKGRAREEPCCIQ